MKKYTHQFLLKLSVVMLFLGVTTNAFTQNKEVAVELDKKLNQYSKYTEVPDKGVLVIYPTIKKTVSFTVIFFDENLQKKWEISELKLSNSKFNKYYYEYDRNSYSCIVTPTGKYAYLTSLIEDIVYRIDIETGKLETIPLTIKINRIRFGNPSNLYTVNFNVDDNYYYYSEITNESSTRKLNTISINRINHNENKFESFSFEFTPPNGDDKPKWAGGESNRILQKWELFFIKDNKIFLKDNFPHEGENKIGYRKMAVYSIDGKILSEANFQMGHRVSQEFKNYSGVISYNSRNKDKIYTFALVKDEPATIEYKCYDLNLKLVWEKSFVLKPDEKFKKSDVFVDVFHNYDNTLTLYTSNGSMYIDSEGNKPNFKPLCIDTEFFIYINCYAYEKVEKLMKPNFIINDLKKYRATHRAFEIQFFKIKDKFIYTFTTYQFGGTYYRLASFPIK
ncbi:MAG: hypothetical protein K0B10_09305 [Vicingaceae bacterium]|nr:hypothetical protein [Vicingaceae bacterium]